METLKLSELSEEDRSRLADLVRLAIEDMTSALAAHPSTAVPDPGLKPGDVAREHRLRLVHLRRVRAGQLAEALVEEVVAEQANADAADAVWLGASLADLGSATGITRQAARKRWPGLGLIYRTRRWLSGHTDDLTAVIGTLLTYNVHLRTADGHRERLDAALESLGDSLHGLDRPDRWQRLSTALDTHLRQVLELATAATPEATSALDGARGVLAHYDSVRASTADDQP
jgi:hypothetical protein